MFTLMEKLVAWTWGLPEYAQFFFWLAVILGVITLGGVALRVHDCWMRKGLLDRRVGKPKRFINRYQRPPKKDWDYTFCRGMICSTCQGMCPKPLEPDASEIAFNEAYYGSNIRGTTDAERERNMEHAALRFAASGDSSRFMSERDRV